MTIPAKNTSRPLWQWSACDLAGAIRAGDISCTEAVTSVVERVRASNDKINAIVDDLTDQALEQAVQHDQQLRKGGGPLGPLHGVPVTTKVNVDYEGCATTNGVTGYKDIIAPGDAPVVSNLRKAGAIIIGRTNTPEFSFRATTDNELHGRTLNPWDEQRSPGGSSGGGSAAVAMGYGPVGHGNDIGGSLRFPSFMCGLVTVRPTLGRIPAYNPSASAERGLLAQLMSVQGAMTREARDLRLATRAMAAQDLRDPWQVPVPFDGPAIDPPIKVGLSRETLGYNIDPAISEALDRTAEILEQSGYRVEEVKLPFFEEAARDALPSMFGETNILLGSEIKKQGSATIKRMFEEYFELLGCYEPVDLIQAMARRSRYLRAWNLFLDEYPLVLTPFLMRTTYEWDEDARGPEAAADIFRASPYSWTINFLGLPAGIAPAGLYNGLPISVQLVGRRYREDLCIDAVEAIERVSGVQTFELWQREGWMA